MMMLEFSFPPPKKDCLTVGGGDWSILAFSAELYVHVIFKEKVLNYSINYQTVPLLCSFF